MNAVSPLSLADLEAHDTTAPMRSPERRFLCPLPACADHQRPASDRCLNVNLDSGAWNCKRCGASGLLLDRQKSENYAARTYAPRPSPMRRSSAIPRALFPSVLPAPPADGRPSQEWKEQIQNLAIAGTPGEIYLSESRGIPAEIADKARVQFCPSWYGRPAVLFLLSNRDGGELLAAQGRYLSDARPKVRSAGTVGEGVFATPGAWEADPLIITEGPIDALSLYACGRPALALCGKDVRPWLVKRLAGRRVLIATDADAAGDEAGAAYLAALHPYTHSAARWRPPCKDWNALLLAAGSPGLRAALESAPFVESAGYGTRADFALSGDAFRFFSEVLGEEIIIAADNAHVPEGAGTVYRAREMGELRETSYPLSFWHMMKTGWGELLEIPPAQEPGPDDVPPGDRGNFVTLPAPGAAFGPQLELPDPAPASSAPGDAEKDNEETDAQQAGPAATGRGAGGLKHWPTAFIDTVTGRGVDDGGQAVDLGARPSLAAILAFVLHTGTKKVYLCGLAPGGRGSAKATQGQFRAWAMSPETGELWQDGFRGKSSHLGDLHSAGAQSEDFPTIRKMHRETRHECTFYRMAAWIGEGDYSPGAARAAMCDLAATLARHFHLSAALELTATPAHTGQELWARFSKRRPADYPPLPDDVQRLIKSTSGQGRIELCPAVETIPGFVYLDARFAYAASLGNLPAGLPVHDDKPDFDPNARGRYKVRFQVPADWDKIGLFMTPRADSSSLWEYPCAPGQIAETWAGWTEVKLARNRGWKVEILERLLFPEAAGRVGDKAGPLDTWGQHLTAAYNETSDPLVKKALRSILLFGIGAFARQERPHRFDVPARDVDTLPVDNATIRRDPETGDFSYWASDPLPASRARLQHPEWAADVWARTRTRMLYYPVQRGVGAARRVVAEWGALTVPRESVIAIRTDALYLSYDPAWPDDGKPGAMRVKGQIAGPLAAPRTFRELDALREQSEQKAGRSKKEKQTE